MSVTLICAATGLREGCVTNLHREANEEMFSFLRRMCFLYVLNVRACLLCAQYTCSVCVYLC